MTSAAIDLGATIVRVAHLGPDGIAVVGASDGTDALPATVWLADRGMARVGTPGPEAPPDQIVTTVRADLRADPRATALRRYFHGRFESPESVAGYLLADAASRVAALAGATVTEVVLGVPVAAADGPVLRRAAAAAGLTVAGMIAEPVAVALHYGAVADGVDQVAVVHDLGGTTLDVSVLRISGRNVAILRSARYPIGGRQFDHALAGELLTETGTATAVSDGAVLARAERLRIGLSDAEEVSERFSGPSGAREVHLDRTRLEAVTAHLLDQIVARTRLVIEEAAVGGARVDAVLLAGGASQMPMVARALSNGLGLAVRASQPQLAVVRGLALAQEFGLLFVTGQNGAPLDLPATAAPPRAAPTTPGAQPPRSSDHEQPAPVPRDQAQPPPAAAPAGGPPAGAADVAAPEPPTPRPVARLRWLRRGERLVLTWDWPPGSVEALVRWQSDADLPGRRGSARCSKRQYDHDGGFELRVGREGAEITVEALGYWDRPNSQDSATLRITPAPPAVTYDPRLRREWRHWKEWLGKGMVRWMATVRFASEANLSLPSVLVVLGTGGYRPQSALEGEVVHVVAPQQLLAGVPASVSFELTLPRGTCWLVCLRAEDEPANDDTPTPADLRPASLHRLKVRP